MKILLTGAFGNIGANVLPELLARGHSVRCFDVPSKANQQRASRLAGQAEVVWGDLRQPADVAAALQGQDVVVHLAFIIPHLSATGIRSEDQPDLAHDVNVGGTMNLLAAMQDQPQRPRMLFTSSLHVYGKTDHLPPPRTVNETLAPVEHYAQQKVACEEIIRASGVDWAILRLGASMPIRLILDTGVFEVPLANRIEYVHSRDVATAIANAVTTDEAWGQTWLVGGGPRCQYHYREVAERVLDAFGIGMLPDAAFNTVPYSTDWLDTSASQRVLRFQQRTLQDYVNDVRAHLGHRRFWIQAFRPLIRQRLLAASPYYRANRPPRAGTAVLTSPAG